MSKNQPVLPGSWLGVVGGGQLGRMFVHAAQRLGYHVAVFESEKNCPAGQAADRHFRPGDSQAEQVASITEMAQLCAAITLEFENVDSQLVRAAAEFAPTRPNADFLEICQDRVNEKSSLSSAGFPTTPFVPVSSLSDVKQAGLELGFPLVLKTARSGYDGKGQAKVEAEQDIETIWSELGSEHAIAEAWIEYKAEVSMITARNPSGQIESFPLLENQHSNHILDVTRCPVSDSLAGLEETASTICRGIAEAFDVTGLFCVEFFVTKSGELLINEIAPRPHNSGHLTIEAFTCSQFEQQVRAICNLPLVASDQLRPAAMVNLLGDVWEHGEPNWMSVLRDTNASLHLYGKAAARVGRKMGHLTYLSTTPDDAVTKARQLRRELARHAAPADF